MGNHRNRHHKIIKSAISRKSRPSNLYKIKVLWTRDKRTMYSTHSIRYSSRQITELLNRTKGGIIDPPENRKDYEKEKTKIERFSNIRETK